MYKKKHKPLKVLPDYLVVVIVVEMLKTKVYFLFLILFINLYKKKYL